MISKEKEQLHVLISCSVMDSFRKELSVNKRTVRKGLLTNEIENAIKNWTVCLRTRNNMQQQNTSSQQNKVFGLIQLRDKIFEYMIDRDLWVEPMRYITKSFLMEAIGALRGTDPRTVNGWIHKLKHAGIIEQSGIHEYRFCDLDGLETLQFQQQQLPSSPLKPKIQTGYLDRN